MISLVLFFSFPFSFHTLSSTFTRLSTEESQYWRGTCGTSTKSIPEASWQVQVFNIEKQKTCGGVAITAYHVITLPYCIRNSANEFASVDNIYVVTHDRMPNLPCNHELIGGSECLLDEEFTHQANRVIHYIVPVFRNKTMTHEFRIALLEVEDRYYMSRIIPACLRFSQVAIPRGMGVWTYSYDSTKQVPTKYKSLFNSTKKICVSPEVCEYFLATTTEGKIGDGWTTVASGPTVKQIPVIALRTTEFEAVAIPQWSHFICIHTGACDADLYDFDKTETVVDYNFDGSKHTPFLINDFPHFASSDVGKQYLEITKFVATLCSNSPCVSDTFVTDFARTVIDVAIAQLEGRVPLNYHIRPICIPEEHSSQFQKGELIVQNFTGEPLFGYSRHLAVTTVESFNCDQSNGQCDLTKNEELKLDPKYEIGAPLVVFENSRLKLIGVTSNKIDKNKAASFNLGTRIDYLATFICVHTGVCRRKEEYKGETFSPYINKNFIVETYGIEKIRKERTSDHNVYANWEAMTTEYAKITQEMAVFKLNRLNEQENEEVQESCGKLRPSPAMIDGSRVSLIEYPWAVMPAFHLKHLGEKRDGFMVIGTGSFISKRHVITAAHIFDYMNAYGKQIFNVIYGTNCSGKAECQSSTAQRIAKVRRVLRTNSNMDISIMELYDDIEPDATHSILCMPRLSEEYNNDRPLRLFGAGYLTSNMSIGSTGDLRMREFVFKDLNVTNWKRWGNESLLYYFITYPEKTKHFGMPGDSGGPIVRQRADGTRNVLWAVHSGMLKSKEELKHEEEERAKSYAINTEQIHKFVCKFSGVCPNGYNNYNESYFPVTFSDNVPLC